MTASAFTLGQAGRLLGRLACLLPAWLAFPAFCQPEASALVASYAQDEIGTDPTGWTAVQDSQGVMYFGCHELVTFDGKQWRTAPIKGGYALRGLDFGGDGRLWAAAEDVGWFERSPEGWSFRSLRSRLPFDPAQLSPAWQVFAEGNGAVFITEDKILRWDGKKFQVWPMPGARRLIATRIGETIYVHHRPSGIYALRAEGPVKVISSEVLGDLAVYWMEPRPNGNWFFVTSKGLFELVAGELRAIAPEASKFVQRGSLTCVAPLPDGRFALGTFQAGIAIIRDHGDVERLLDESTGLPTRAIYSLFSDAEKGLWATSANRIFRVSLNAASQLFDQRAGLPAQQIRTILRHRGQLVVATENEIYFQPENGPAFQRLPEISGRVIDLRSTPEGLLFSQPRAVRLLSPNGVKNLYTTLADPNLAKPSRLTPETLFVSEGRKILSLAGDTPPRTVVEDLPDIASSLAEDGRGQLWLGTTTRGILLAKPTPAGSVKASPPDPGLGLPAFSGLASVIGTKAGTIVVLAPEGGWVLRPAATKFVPIEHYPAERKLAAFSSFAADDRVWTLHASIGVKPALIAEIRLLADGGAVWEPHAIEGLSQIGTPRGFLAEPGPAESITLWIGGTKGLLRHTVAQGPFAPPPRAPVLHAYSRTSESGPLQTLTSSLPYSTNAVSFQFAAPQFSLGPALRLETFLDGSDRDWVPADASGHRELTALREGRYTFRVRAVADTGVASEPASVHFVILPPWWRSAPALGAGLLVLAGGVYGGFRLRVLALRRRNAALEKKVRQRTAELAKASAAKTEFVANMSHDIRNPLNGVVGLALALENTRLDPQQQEIVATLRECTTYLSSLVDDVLDFASIEAGQVELRPGPFAPAELLRSVATTLKGEAAAQGATLLIETAPNVPPVLLGDAGRIQQILVNYASNALKYAGGTIRLTAKLTSAALDEIEFAVVDEGPGITPADQAKLFTKFNRLPNAHGEAIKGSGLGLAACRSLADLMGGSVGVQSAREVGSTFYLRLPLAVSEPAADTPAFALPSATVLIVEDADYNAMAATAVLNRLGLPSERARNGKEAIELFGNKRFDVVLLDRHLPDMDGTLVAKRLREIEADNPRAILLAVTAYCTAEDRALCLAAGMDAFVGKPLTPAKLRQVLLAAGRRLLTAASVQVSPEPSTPAVDLSLLSYIADGTEQGLGDQIERFLATLAQVENQLEHASSARDFSALATSAHQVLSQAKMVGDTALENAAVALENAARAEEPAAFGLLFEPVRREIRALTEALRRRRSATYAT